MLHSAVYCIICANYTMSLIGIWLQFLSPTLSKHCHRSGFVLILDCQICESTFLKTESFIFCFSASSSVNWFQAMTRALLFWQISGEICVYLLFICVSFLWKTNKTIVYCMRFCSLRGLALKNIYFFCHGHFISTHFFTYNECFNWTECNYSLMKVTEFTERLLTFRSLVVISFYLSELVHWGRGLTQSTAHRCRYPGSAGD